MTAGQRLALQAHRAGYDRESVEFIANLAFRHRPGEPLREDQRINELTVAVEVCAQAGYDARTLRLVAEHCYASCAEGDDWRARFWSLHLLPAANRRFRNPGFYGVSPCETASLPPARLPTDLLALTGAEQLT
jgi:hypothetical protein